MSIKRKTFEVTTSTIALISSLTSNPLPVFAMSDTLTYGQCIYYSSAPPTLASNTWAPCRLDSGQNILVDIANGAISGANIGGALLTGNNGVQMVLNTGNNATTPHLCGSQKTITVSTANDTQIVANVSGQNIYICDVMFSFGGAANAYLESSNGAAGPPCTGTLTQMGLTWYANAVPFTKTQAMPFYTGFPTPGAGNSVCVHTTSTGPVSFTVIYDQY